MRTIGISQASLFPYSWGPGGLARAWALAKEAGFDGLQILPLRYCDRSSSIPQDAVLSIEGPWNSGSLWGALRRHMGRAGEEEPLLLDWLLFGGKKEAAKLFRRLAGSFNQAMNVIHTPGSLYDIFEVNPEAKMSIAEIQKIGALCLDNCHIQRKGRHGEPRISARLIELLEPSQVQLLHYNLRDESRGRVIMAVRLGKKFQCPVVVECAPVIGTPRAVIRELQRLQEETRELFQ